ncbi:GntR family transcriptional regulator [Mesorhizobium sp. CAU 1732]|uniref:GntR family transcriptional regulator n=1 Tax=Mesorhizobium sp. CAU 1732 TaxID=3140358 RepID=UPI003260C346
MRTAKDGTGLQSTLGVLGPVARHTVQDQVYGELRRSLIQGLFDAGEVLRIRDLAQRMSISTMPVREALARLISEKALEPLPNRSVRVPLIRRETLEDLARARALIEGRLTEMALPRLGAEDRDALWRDTDAYDNLTGGRIETAHEAADLNHAFHFRIYRAAGSAVLIPIVESLWMQSGPYIRKAAELFDHGSDAPATNHHHRLLEAIEAGDVAAGRAALVADIDRAFDLLRRRHTFDREAA